MSSVAGAFNSAGFVGGVCCAIRSFEVLLLLKLNAAFAFGTKRNHDHQIWGNMQASSGGGGERSASNKSIGS